MLDYVKGDRVRVLEAAGDDFPGMSGREGVVTFSTPKYVHVEIEGERGCRHFPYLREELSRVVPK
mgnify:CR=1 FL=1